MSSTAIANSEYELSAGLPLIERPSRVRRARQAFTRYLIAIGFGVAATLAWQSYGDEIKQTVAARAPELGWSPEVQQLIGASLEQIGWIKPAGLERGAMPAAAPQTAQQASIAATDADSAASKPSAGPAPTLQQVQQITSDLAALKQAVEQLSSNQGQMTQDIAKVQATDQEVLNKVSANKVAANRVPAPPPPAAAMPTHKHPPGPPTLSAAPQPPQPLPLR